MRVSVIRGLLASIVGIAAGCALAGCPPLEALEASDAGSDGSTPPDASPDGGSDAADAASAPDGPRGEGGDGGACIVVGLDASDADTSCVLGDGSACMPSSAAGAQLGYASARPHVAACNTSQIEEYTTSCGLGGFGNSGCMAFINSTMNANCVSCLTPSPLSDPTWGPILEFSYGTSGWTALNQGGCVELLGGCGTSCAAATQAANQCVVASCTPCCQGASCSPDIQNCQLAATECPCGSYAQDKADCFEQFQATGNPAAACDSNPDAGIQGLYELEQRVIAAFCGGAP